jgi:hypothetical protein
MGSLSIWHWIVVILMIASPMMGIMRGVENGSKLPAVLSAFVPIFGLVYFFGSDCRCRKRSRDFCLFGLSIGRPIVFLLLTGGSLTHIGDRTRPR